MSIGTIYYTLNNKTEKMPIESSNDFDMILVRLLKASEEPQIVEVINKAGDSLGIGIGRPQTVLNYITASKMPPYYTSVGNIDADGYVAFNYGGQESEFPSKHLIPMEQARKAIKHFLENGELDNSINWVED